MQGAIRWILCFITIIFHKTNAVLSNKNNKNEVIAVSDNFRDHVVNTISPCKRNVENNSRLNSSKTVEIDDKDEETIETAALHRTWIAITVRILSQNSKIQPFYLENPSKFQNEFSTVEKTQHLVSRETPRNGRTLNDYDQGYLENLFKQSLQPGTEQMAGRSKDGELTPLGEYRVDEIDGTIYSLENGVKIPAPQDIVQYLRSMGAKPGVLYQVGKRLVPGTGGFTQQFSAGQQPMIGGGMRGQSQATGFSSPTRFGQSSSFGQTSGTSSPGKQDGGKFSEESEEEDDDDDDDDNETPSPGTPSSTGRKKGVTSAGRKKGVTSAGRKKGVTSAGKSRSRSKSAKSWSSKSGGWSKVKSAQRGRGGLELIAIKRVRTMRIDYKHAKRAKSGSWKAAATKSAKGGHARAHAVAASASVAGASARRRHQRSPSPRSRSPRSRSGSPSPRSRSGSPSPRSRSRSRSRSPSPSPRRGKS